MLALGIGVLEGVLEGKRVDIDHDGLAARLFDHQHELVDAIALGRDEHDVHFAAFLVLIENSEIEVHVVDVERDVLLGLPHDRFAQLVLGHAWHGDAAHDDGVSGNRRGDAGALDLVVVEEIADDLGDVTGAHNCTLDDRFARQLGDPEMRQLKWGIATLRLHRHQLHGVRANVQPDDPFVPPKLHELTHGSAPGRRPKWWT